jgi:hypothetical protein
MNRLQSDLAPIFQAAHLLPIHGESGKLIHGHAISSLAAAAEQAVIGLGEAAVLASAGTHVRSA